MEKVLPRSLEWCSKQCIHMWVYVKMMKLKKIIKKRYTHKVSYNKIYHTLYGAIANLFVNWLSLIIKPQIWTLEVLFSTTHLIFRRNIFKIWLKIK
jgi:hypothetical protein